MLPQDISQDFKDAAIELLENLADHDGEATIAQLVENTEIKPALFIEILRFFCDHKLIKPLSQNLFNRLNRAANQVAGRASKNPAKLLLPAWRRDLAKNFNDTVEVKVAENTPLNRLDELFEIHPDKAHEKLEANGNELLSILSNSQEGMQLATLAQLAKMPAEDFLRALHYLSKTRVIDRLPRVILRQLSKNAKDAEAKAATAPGTFPWADDILRKAGAEERALKRDPDARTSASRVVRINRSGEKALTRA